jgi:hypothetical protein
MTKLLWVLFLAAIAVPAQARNAEDYWCGKVKNRIHLMMWIAKVQEPMRDDEGQLIRDKEGNVVWARAADGRTYSQHGIINHKLPEDHPNWVTIVPERLIRRDSNYNVFFRGEKCTTFTEEDQEKYGVGYYGPRWDLRYPHSKEIEREWSEPSCARVSDKLPVEPDGSYLNLRIGPGTEFKAQVKLPAGTGLKLDAVSRDGKWRHVRSAAIEGEIYNGWVRGKFLLDQTCKAPTPNETAIPLSPDPAQTDKPWWEERTKVDLKYLEWLGKNPSLVPLKMKDADWCRKRDHQDPACLAESEIEKRRRIDVNHAPRDSDERPTECPKWLGVSC